MSVVLTCDRHQKGDGVVFSVADVLAAVIHGGCGYNQSTLGPVHLQDQIGTLLYLQAVFVPPDMSV